MNKTSLFLLVSRKLASAALMSLGGCATFVSSEQYTGSQTGFVYALPVPFLEVIPNSDGTLTVNQIYLPDPEKEYVINTWSMLAAYKLVIDVDENKLLRSVSMDGKASAVAEQALKSAGEFGKARLDAETAAAKAEQERSDEIAGLRSDLAIAVAKRDRLIELSDDSENGIKPEQIVVADLAVTEARAKLDSALGVDRSAARDGSDSASADAVNGTVGPTAPGPVYLRVEQYRVNDEPSVRLVAVNMTGSADDQKSQVEYPTATTALPPPPEGKKPTFYLKEGLLVPKSGEPLKIEVTSSEKVDSIISNKSDVRNKKSSDRIIGSVFNLQADQEKVFVFIPPDSINPGDYLITLYYIIGGKEESTEIEFKVG